MQVVGDLKRVKAVFESIREQEGCEDNEGAYSDLNPEVFKWVTYSEEEKCKVAFKYFSHEFNFFLKQRDPEFFESTVRPLLQCKMEKTFVDLYLLDDHQTLLAVYNTLESKLPPPNTSVMASLVNKLISLFKQDD